MAFKRYFHEKDGVGSDVPNRESKRVLTLQNDARDVMRWLPLNEIGPRMEPIIRRLVQEVVESKISPFLHPSPRSSLDPIETSKGRGLQLRFSSKLLPVIFTGCRIESEDKLPIEIVLCDPRTNYVITSGPLSSLKLEILVLHGDFDSNNQQDWTENEFKASVLREREGKRPLLTGELNITLQNGVGYIRDITFTDNSSWTRSQKFRLGARVVQKNPGEIRIREARSEAFRVKDHRGELYKKHYPPSLWDEVWRLEWIAKDGKLDNRLAEYGIKTVKDFLQMYATNSNLLRRILGVSNRKWETITEHANACMVNDGKLYVYCEGAHGVGLLFNSIYNVVGASFNGCQNYMSFNQLTPPQKHVVEKLKQDAYKNAKDFILTDEHAVGFSLPEPFTNLQAEPSSVTNIGELQTQLGLNQPSTSTSYAYEAADYDSQFQISNAQNCYPWQRDRS